MTRLAGRVAVITGGASGIGAETVRLFASEGAQVVAGDVQDELGEKLAAELGENVRYVHADVTRESDVRALVETASADFGRLDSLFNNAGAGGARGELHEIEVEEFDATVALLLRAVFLGIKHALPVMREQRSGSIISTASVAGLQAGLGPHVYSACKAGVVHLSRTAALELGAWANPGQRHLPRRHPDAAAGERPGRTDAGPVRRARPGRGRPPGRPADPASRTAGGHRPRGPVARQRRVVVEFTGQAIVVDGGLTAGRWGLQRGPAPPDS